MKNKILVLILFLLITASAAQGQIINFMAIGDWGREGKNKQKETADEMGVYADKNKCDFVITLGDNIYETGVTGTDDPKWQTCFEQVYTAPSLEIPWYASLGNHDYGGNVQAQIDYSAFSKKWRMPARYYAFEKNINGNSSVLFVIIDSSPFIESYRKMNKENEELNNKSVWDINTQDSEVQLKWIDSVLSHSTAKWKILAGHHPLYSGGEHGNSKDLIEKLEPLLEKYKVDMYLAGHDHDMQYLKKEGSSVNYFVSGAGSKLRETGPMEYTKFCKSINGFLGVTVSGENIKASFVDYAGNNLYDVEITK